VADQLAATIAAAKAADVVVLVLGLNAKITNMEGQDREHDQAGYALPGEQVTLARKIAALGKPTVAVVLSGMAVGMDFLAQQSRENSANPVSENGLLSHLYINAIILPRQARDKHRETSKTDRFSQVPWSILVPGYGGRFGSEALAEALFGKFSPSGRLGYTVSHGRSKQCSAGAPDRCRDF
jgi:hypothetical protein